MEKTCRSRSKSTIIQTLPERVRDEILHLLPMIRQGFSRLCEIRLRAYGRCALVLDDCTLPLFSQVDEDGLCRLLSRLCNDSAYAFRDAFSSGYLPLSAGVRVGVSGTAAYEGGRAVGVGGISSAVFRFPSGECEVAEEIAEAFVNRVRRAMIIYSPPGVGKTEALRSLAKILSSGKHKRRVAVIDQRREFIPEDYVGCHLDLLVGYSKPDGVEVALRNLSPEVIITDELGSRDAEYLQRAVSCGVPVVTTVHAGNLEDMKSRLARLGVDPGLFDVAIGLSRQGASRRADLFVAEDDGVQEPCLLF